MKHYIKDGVVRRHSAIVQPEIIDGISFDVFNPSEEMLLASGWDVYSPPVPEIPKEEQYKQRIVELIRERYSLDDEIAILRQRDSKPEEFAEYDAYVEQCKNKARQEIWI
ncbi:MAG: hypothetical protein UHK44_07755 [Bacteroidaceae bacterium]|nr:hypothetical protein [Bacteroidaceae bacterium]